ncbi:MAG: flavodoxin domain-containing protein [Candidatus Saccharicenans sp.]|uniref:flavodoxin domain-containing protein n=1 Tax=Candidatus Saccharicenans sp. TaxID=2819258 RepID=UPI00404A2A8E
MPKTLIVYVSRHGTTEKAVEILKQELPEATTCNLMKESCPPLENFDRVIIGGSIHAGRIQKKIKNFCRKNLALLLTKEIALFICCMYDGQKAEDQFNQAFPEELRQKARVKGIFGGELLFEKMNFLERTVIKKFIGVKESISRFQPEEIKEFAVRLKA